MDVDTRHIERTEETFDPESQVVRSEQRNKETSSGATIAAGVPGVLSNMPGDAQQATVAAAQPQSQRQDEVINYEINKVVSHVVEPIVTVKRLTVAVLVDGTYNTVKDSEGKDTRQYNPRNDDDITKFTAMVKNAVGFSEERGDLITVASTPFEESYVEPSNEPEEISFVSSVVSVSILPTVIKYASIVAVAFFAMLFVLKPIMKRITSEREALDMIQKTLPEGFVQPELALAPGVEKDSLEKL
jgi:flagellar M-ring protein FliF